MDELTCQDCNIQYAGQYEVVLIKGDLESPGCITRLKEVMVSISEHLKAQCTLRVYFALENSNKKIKHNVINFLEQLESVRSHKKSIRIFWLYPIGNNKVEHLGYFLQTSFSMTFAILPSY
ncbi:MAG: hypothetical protein CMB80_31615 [Flammeovirgaceae bacterium]|nr:hypothetical protein [Flammeovirgaceae bacterium]MBE61747.1 hypothetical protein [Flammeovirgaceae bacterium]MBR06634.1 hypothetical protein [Rickettsiales bacterium]HCX24092.1 hypothetical protein [Cytophagales bacterium]|tara:strand:- start:79 stop:441 length:363 start_codon:yes stop_codon:yes gene_type:complete